MILDLFKNIKECQHDKISPDVDKAYCPDCGAYVENRWYLARCGCCNIKRVSYVSFNSVKPVQKYCPNCGSSGFYLEELEHVNFIDINFAVVKKITLKEGEGQIRSQFWVDDKENAPQNLLGVL